MIFALEASNVDAPKKIDRPFGMSMGSRSCPVGLLSKGGRHWNHAMRVLSNYNTLIPWIFGVSWNGLDIPPCLCIQQPQRVTFLHVRQRNQWYNREHIIVVTGCDWFFDKICGIWLILRAVMIMTTGRTMQFCLSVLGIDTNRIQRTVVLSISIIVCWYDFNH
jgi:hypothetical protein